MDGLGFGQVLLYFLVSLIHLVAAMFRIVTGKSRCQF